MSRPIRPKSRGEGLSDDLTQHFAADVGQLAESASVEVAEVFIVEAHQVEDRGVNVADGDRFAHGAQTE